MANRHEQPPHVERRHRTVQRRIVNIFLADGGVVVARDSEAVIVRQGNRRVFVDSFGKVRWGVA